MFYYNYERHVSFFSISTGTRKYPFKEKETFIYFLITYQLKFVAMLIKNMNGLMSPK